MTEGHGLLEGTPTPLEEEPPVSPRHRNWVLLGRSIFFQQRRAWCFASDALGPWRDGKERKCRLCPQETPGQGVEGGRAVLQEDSPRQRRLSWELKVDGAPATGQPG